MDESETAQALGWPRGTVKSRLNRALRKLSQTCSRMERDARKGGESMGEPGRDGRDGPEAGRRRPWRRSCRALGRGIRIPEWRR